jgi:hypothetical protein
MSQYSSKLRSPMWQKRRLEILELHKWKCAQCGCATKELHCHHIHYRKDAEPWEYLDCEIIALCKTCHDEIRDKNSLFTSMLYLCNSDVRKKPMDLLEFSMGYIDGLNGVYFEEQSENYNTGYVDGSDRRLKRGAE